MKRYILLQDRGLVIYEKTINEYSLFKLLKSDVPTDNWCTTCCFHTMNQWKENYYVGESDDINELMEMAVLESLS